MKNLTHKTIKELVDKTDRLLELFDGSNQDELGRYLLAAEIKLKALKDNWNYWISKTVEAEMQIERLKKDAETIRESNEKLLKVNADLADKANRAHWENAIANQEAASDKFSG